MVFHFFCCDIAIVVETHMALQVVDDTNEFIFREAVLAQFQKVKVEGKNSFLFNNILPKSIFILLYLPE